MAAASRSDISTKFGAAARNPTFSLSDTIAEAKVFCALELDKPTPKGFATNHTTFNETYKYLADELVPHIVFCTEGFDLSTDFKYEDLLKCMKLLELIRFKAGEPEANTLLWAEYFGLYTDAYAWILNKCCHYNVGTETAREFESFVLEYTGFESVYLMREFIDIVFAPRQLIDTLTLNEEVLLLEFDGLHAGSPSVKNFVNKTLRRLTKKMTRALNSGDTLAYESAFILLNRFVADFAPEDSSRPGPAKQFSLPWIV
jgi:hypothetical protein